MALFDNVGANLASMGTGGVMSPQEAKNLTPQQRRNLRLQYFQALMNETPQVTLAANYQTQQQNNMLLEQQKRKKEAIDRVRANPNTPPSQADLITILGAKDYLTSMRGGKERRIVEGVDGRKYYENGDLVLPNVTPKAKNPFEIKTADVVGAQKDERKTFEAANKGVKNFQQLLDAAQSASGAASYALMIKFIKQLDDSVVRDSEVATFGGFQGALENLRLFSSKTKGEGFTPAVKANMINLATQTANRLVEDYNTYRAGKAISYSAIGFKPDMIFAGLDFNLGDLDLTRKYAPEDFEFIEFE